MLLELASENEAVRRRRLARLQLTERSERLAEHLRNALERWRRGAMEDLDEDETRAFGQSLQGWVCLVERELLTRSPATALELAEAFLECDAALLEHVDDPLNFVAQAFRAGCELWLRAAARCEAPASGWPQRLAQLASADSHAWRAAGAAAGRVRTALLVDQLEGQLAQQVAAHCSGIAPAAQVMRISADLSLLAQALRDLDLHVHTVLRYSPQPDPQQKQEYVQRYLQCDTRGASAALAAAGLGRRGLHAPAPAGQGAGAAGPARRKRSRSSRPLRAFAQPGKPGCLAGRRAGGVARGCAGNGTPNRQGPQRAGDHRPAAPGQRRRHSCRDSAGGRSQPHPWQ
nr:DUF6880 family protein [Azohydromonas australica]